MAFFSIVKVRCELYSLKTDGWTICGNSLIFCVGECPSWYKTRCLSARRVERAPLLTLDEWYHLPDPGNITNTRYHPGSVVKVGPLAQLHDPGEGWPCLPAAFWSAAMDGSWSSSYLQQTRHITSSILGLALSRYLSYYRRTKRKRIYRINRSLPGYSCDFLRMITMTQGRPSIRYFIQTSRGSGMNAP